MNDSGGIAVQNSEYEHVAYPKLNHVKIGFVEIGFRNPHIHRELEMGVVLDGAARMTVSAHSMVLNRGALYFVNANEPHTVASEGSGRVRIAFLQVSNRFCQDYLHLFRNLELMWHNLTGHISADDNLALTRLLMDVFIHYMDDGDLCLLKSMNAICQLFSRLLDIVPYRRFDEAAYQARKLRTARLVRITEYISAHYTERLSLATLAEMEGVTATHLSHFIHDNLNMTFQEYVNNLRLERAVHLLVNTRLRLTDISLESGFSDIKYLNRAFLARYGCLPRDYRQPAFSGAAVSSAGGEENQFFASDATARAWLEDYRATILA